MQMKNHFDVIINYLYSLRITRPTSYCNITSYYEQIYQRIVEIKDKTLIFRREL